MILVKKQFTDNSHFFQFILWEYKFYVIFKKNLHNNFLTNVF